MELRDLIVSPILLILVYGGAFLIRPHVTDHITRRYFIPAFTVRIIGALGVGFIYQFYYNGGDTFNYHTHGSRVIYEAFLESPETGLKLLFSDGSHAGVYEYTSRIPLFTDWSSYNVIRLAAVFDLFTFSSYSGTAILFAVFSFFGMWLFFQTFYQQYPHLHKGLAFAAFFIPSVFFWGSGVLKDTISLTFLGIATYQTYRIFILKKYSALSIILFLVCLYGIYSIKVYILMNFLPAAIFWVFLKNLGSISSPVLRAMLFPVVFTGALAIGYYAVQKASEDNPKYSLNKLAETARITAYDIRYYTGRDAGSGYSLGELDGSFGSMVRLAPAAINASLFRPYVWEIKNPLMALSAAESLALLVLVLYIFIKNGIFALRSLIQPDILFSLVFSISFAFAVGVSTFNFGTLVRYKIPVLPFFIVGLILIQEFSNRERKARALALTE